MSFHKPLTAMTLQDVQDREVAAGNNDYANAVGRYPHLTDGAVLNQIPADLTLIKQRLPLHGFDPSLSKSEKAYKATRRKIIAAVKNATGEAEAARERRARVDEWAELLTALEPHAVTEGERKHRAKQILIPVRKLADVARASDIKPSQVCQDWLDTVSPTLETNEWKTLQRAFKTLNKFRHDDNVCRYLPVAPFPSPEPRRQENLHLIPPHIADEIDDWVRNATLTEFDPVEQEHVNTASLGITTADNEIPVDACSFAKSGQ